MVYINTFYVSLSIFYFLSTAKLFHSYIRCRLLYFLVANRKPRCLNLFTTGGGATKWWFPVPIYTLLALLLHPPFSSNHRYYYFACDSLRNRYFYKNTPIHSFGRINSSALTWIFQYNNVDRLRILLTLFSLPRIFTYSNGLPRDIHFVFK